MRALVDAGDSVGALEHARMYDRVVRAELDTAPDPEVTRFADALRAAQGDAVRTPVKTETATASRIEPAGESGATISPRLSSAPSRHAVRRSRLYAGAVLVIGLLSYGTARWARRPSSVAATGLPPSIVVLPVVNVSATDREDRLTDGMTEQLISALARTGGLRVIGRTSAFAFKGSKVGARAIADSLHVSNVLESALEVDGSHLRVTVRLVDARSELARWEQRYDRDLRDVFAVEDDIVHSVARELRVRLAVGGVAQRQTSNLVAHDLYVRARAPQMLRADSTVHAAIALLEQATKLDTTYVDAYAALAELHANAVYGGDVGPDGRREAYRRARMAADRALALDSSSAAAHLALGVVHLFGYEFRQAEVELEQARSLDPGLQGASGYFEGLYQWTGRSAESIAEARRDVVAEPLSAAATAGLSHALYFDRRYDEARAEIDKLTGLTPPLRRAPQYRVEILLAQHRWEEAIVALRPPAPQLPRLRGLLGYALARSGRRAEAMRLLTELRDGVPSGKGNAFAVSQVYAGLGDFDHAFMWLDSAVAEYTLLPAVMGPAFDSLRADPRFEILRNRLGLNRR
jgi:serine/threonine-protein kinase